jgi:hypothetical protein
MRIAAAVLAVAEPRVWSLVCLSGAPRCGVVVAALVYPFVRPVTTVSAVIFLVSAEDELATVFIVNRVINGDYGVALASSTALMALMAAALAISDRIIVMNNAVVAQEGSPRDLYERPADAFVAGFIGESNRLAVDLEPAGAAAAPPGCADLSRNGAPDGRVVVALRPGAVRLSRAGDRAEGTVGSGRGGIVTGVQRQWQNCRIAH